MKIVEINKPYNGNLSPYFTYFPFIFNKDGISLKMNISVEVSSEIENGILEYQRYVIKSIDTFDTEYTVDDYNIIGINITEEQQKVLLEDIYDMLKENEHVFLKVKNENINI